MKESDLTVLSTPITQETADMSDPRQHCAWALRYFPSPNQQMGDVPIHPTVRPGFSQLLSDLGFEHNPDKQTKWFIPGDHPEAGDYLNLPKLVGRREYEEYLATRTDPVVAESNLRDVAAAALAKIDPDLANLIANGSDEDKAKALAAQREHLPAAVKRLAELKDLADAEAEKAAAAAEAADGDGDGGPGEGQ